MKPNQLINGRFRLEEIIGVGGMSVVWRAHDVLLNRRVAAKVLAGPDATRPSARQLVLDEARAAAGLSHPHITGVFDVGETMTHDDHRVNFVVMEFLEGMSLAERMRVDPPGPAEGLQICADVASALSAAHSVGIVHCDIKPSNIMLTRAGAKVIDFGIAAMDGDREFDGVPEVLGTPAYLAPERLSGEDVSPAVDMYALGVLTFLVLNRELPWQPGSPSQLIAAHVADEPATVPVRSGVLAPVDALVYRCLARDPGDRPSSDEAAAVLAAAARGFVGPASAQPTIVMTGTTPRRRVMLPVGAAVLLLAAGAAVIATMGAQSGTAHEVLQPARDGWQPPTMVVTNDAGLPGAETPTVPGLGPTSGSRPVPLGVGVVASPSATPTPGASSAGAGPLATVTHGEPSVSALGGTVYVQCTGSYARITRVVLAPQYSMKDYDPGPDQEVRAVLISLTNESEIRARCGSDGPEVTVKESPK